MIRERYYARETIDDRTEKRDDIVDMGGTMRDTREERRETREG